MKIAGSSKGYSPSIETRNKLSKALKRVYTGEKNPLLRTKPPMEAPRELMSQVKKESKTLPFF